MHDSQVGVTSKTRNEASRLTFIDPGFPVQFDAERVAVGPSSDLINRLPPFAQPGDQEDWVGVPSAVLFLKRHRFSRLLSPLFEPTRDA